MHTVGELVQLLEKVPGDEAEEDMLGRHIYKGVPICVNWKLL